jgi:hypothetical protein
LLTGRLTRDFAVRIELGARPLSTQG